MTKNVLSLEEKIAELRDSGYTVTGAYEVSQEWENIHTTESFTVIGYYWLADGCNNYGQMAYMSNGDGWRWDDLTTHFRQV
jgi:hypothetical protein